MQRRRIAVVAHNVRVGGGLVVALNIVAALRRVADDHQYLLILPADAGYEGLPLPSNCEVSFFRRSGTIDQVVFEMFALERIVRGFSPDAVLGLSGFGIGGVPGRQGVLTMRPQWLYPQKERSKERLRVRLESELARWRLRRSLDSIDVMFCQTDVAALRFRQTFGFTGPIVVLPPVVSELLRSAPPDLAVPTILDDLGSHFVLFALTRYYTHKNLEALLRTFEAYGDDLKSVRVILTVSPQDHPKAASFLAALQASPAVASFKNVGPVRHEDLAGFYGRADAVILPTLLESFSSTYLEAMHYRRPILTSDRDFAREACGDAALYFDPNDPSSIRDTILRIQASASERGRLCAAGINRLQAVGGRTWDDVTREALAALL